MGNQLKRKFSHRRIDPLIRIPVMLLACLTFVKTSRSQASDDTLSLKGTWRFAMDSADQGMKELFYTKKLPETILLPGSMVQNDKGYDVTLKTQWTASIYDSSWYFDPRMAPYRKPQNLKFPFFLTPNKRYVDPAWYQKTINIPAGWKGSHISLYLERVHWESTVWVDDQKIGMQNSLSAPHVYDLSQVLSPGSHILTIRVDNRIKAINPGPDSHSLTDQTQGNWNGIVGRICLVSQPPVWISRIETYPDPSHKSVRVQLDIRNRLGTVQNASIRLSAKSFNTPDVQSVASMTKNMAVGAGDTIVNIRYPMGSHPQLWDEFHPALYRLHASLSSAAGTDEGETDFGMRTFGIAGTRFTVNGREIFLRGTVENCDFPLTGYPPMDVASWIRVFKIARSYGLNEMRFHSYCPPEAAFVAADLIGFYLHVEGPSWANHGTSLGDGKPIDQYLYNETDRIDRFYGNHPSFCMMAYGNEPRGSHQVNYLNKFVDYWKARDPRHLYTGASTGSSWPWVNEEQFIVRSGPRGLPWAKARPGTLFDHRGALEGHDIPYIAHEVGQYCAFPDFTEIGAYTGVHKAKNFELFQEDLTAHHMGDEAKQFLHSSGELQRLCYKGEIEAALRTPGFAGFELLSLNDYSGQGTALVGVLNVFWQTKGYTTPRRFRYFSGPVVPLARLPTFVYNNDDTLEADLEIANFGEGALAHAQAVWQLTDASGKIQATGSFPAQTLPIGNCIKLGKVTLSLNRFRRAERLTLRVFLRGTSYRNEWPVWVYPRDPDSVAGASDIYFCHTLDQKAKTVLEKGGKVFLLCAGKVRMGSDISMHFLPVFWNTSWFKMRPPHTTGIYVKAGSPAFKYFPTEDFSNFQWWGLVNKQQVMWLKNFPPGFRPLVQPIDTWFLNRRLGLIFEARVGKGKLMVSSADLSTDLAKRPAARQLRYSLTRYMESPDFNPSGKVSFATVSALFQANASAIHNTYSKDSLDDLKPQKSQK